MKRSADCRCARDASHAPCQHCRRRRRADPFAGEAARDSSSPRGAARRRTFRKEAMRLDWLDDEPPVPDDGDFDVEPPQDDD